MKLYGYWNYGESRTGKIQLVLAENKSDAISKFDKIHQLQLNDKLIVEIQEYATVEYDLEDMSLSCEYDNGNYL